MKAQPQLTVNDLLTACKNAQAEGVNSLYIQYNGENLPVDNSISDLANACQNAHSKKVKSLFIQHNSETLPIVNAAIVPNRLSSDLVLFVGATNKEAVNPIKSFLSFLSGAKKQKSPTHAEITPAVIATINQLFNGGDITTKSLLEIKKALAVVSEHFEELSDAQNPLNSDNNGFGGAL